MDDTHHDGLTSAGRPRDPGSSTARPGARPSGSSPAPEPREDVLVSLRERAVAGDSRALDDLLRLLEPVVMRRCARFLSHHADAEEACQDALVALATKLHTYSGSGSFLGWVTVVASNSARSTYRSLKRRAAERATPLLPEFGDPRTTSVIAGSRVDLLEALDALEAAKPHLVEAFVLRDLAGLTYEEVAVQTGAPLGTVKARIHDARRFLRGRLVERLG